MAIEIDNLSAQLTRSLLHPHMAYRSKGVSVFEVSHQSEPDFTRYNGVQSTFSVDAFADPNSSGSTAQLIERCQSIMTS
jgi:hypothetical protein